MEAAEKPNRNYLLWTLLTMFAIVGFIGIYKSNENKSAFQKAEAQALAMEGLHTRLQDPTGAFQKGQQAFALDSTNQQVGRLMFDLFFEAPHFPFHEKIGTFPDATTIDCSPNGRYWGIAKENKLLKLDLGNNGQETHTFPSQLLAISLTDDPNTWAAIDEKQTIHLQHQGKKLEFQLEEKARDYELIFSADAHYFATISEETVAIFNLDSAKQIEIDRLPIGVQGSLGASRWFVFDVAETYAAFCMRERDVYVANLLNGKTQVFKLDAWKEKELFPSSAVFADDIRYNEGYPPALFLGNSSGESFLEVQLESGATSSWDPETVDLFVPNSTLQRDIALARLKLTGSTVLHPAAGSFHKIQEVIWSDALVGVGITEKGSVARFDRISKEVTSLYSSPDGLITKAAVLNSGTVVAVDDQSHLRKWPQKGKLFLENRPYLMEPLYSTPRFEEQEVVFLEKDGTEYRYRLEEGKYTSERDSTREGMAEVQSTESITAADQWKSLTQATLLSSPNWRNIERHFRKIETEVPWQAGQMGQWMYLTAPDKQSLLLALREKDTGRFFNYFAWIPFTPKKIIQIIDSRLSKDPSKKAKP